MIVEYFSINLTHHFYSRFQILKVWQELILDIVIWSVNSPSALWHLTGTILLTYVAPYFSFITQTEAPYIQDAYQACGFIMIHHILSQAMTLGWSLYFDFDVQERHGLNKQSMDVFLKDQK